MSLGSIQQSGASTKPMDLSNLRTSLREEEVSGRRRGAHLRAAEDELNGYFRSSALGLTTLYRQAVAASKASYEKGYAHALAHVLELCDRDRDWLKGYLQRRIEAIEADADDETDDKDSAPPHHPPRDDDHDDARASASPVRTRGASDRTPTTTAGAPRPATATFVGQSTAACRQTNKRTRGAAASHRSSNEDEPADRRMIQRSGASSSRLPARTSNATPASFGSASFDFAAPLAYPDGASARVEVGASRTPMHVRASGSSGAVEGAVIKTSNPAAQRRRLQRLKGLRAGKDRVLEVSRAHDAMDDADDAILQDHEDEAWTDDDDDAEPDKEPARRKLVVWTERADRTHDENQRDESRTVERFDRRKRRRTFQPLSTPSASNDQRLP